MEDSRGSGDGGAAEDAGVTASRRQLLAMAAVGGVGAAAVAGATPASAHDRHQQHGKARGTTFRLTVLGTSDIHGNVLNWDYFKDAEYTDGAANDVGPGQDLDPHHGDAARSAARPAASPSTPATPSRARR